MCLCVRPRATRHSLHILSVVFCRPPEGLCGGSASGKTTVANKIIEALDVPWVVLLSMDSFYKVPQPVNQFRLTVAMF